MLNAEQGASCILRLNIAGLGEQHKRHWHGVDLEDMALRARKLGLHPDAVRHTLRTALWAQIPP